MAKRVTQADLAELLGLDKSSVSLALRGDPRISEETRARVCEMARRYHYRPNLSARQLSASRSRVMGVLLPEEFRELGAPLRPPLLQALAQRAFESDYLLNALPASPQILLALNGEGGYRFLADGVLVDGSAPARYAEALHEHGIPVVVMDPNHVSYDGCRLPCVHMDHAGGARSVCEHLLECGAERLLYVEKPLEHLGLRIRWNTARKTWLSQRPLESLSYSSIDELTDDHLRAFASKSKGAIFCAGDQFAQNVFYRLSGMGVSVPEDVPLAGHDGIYPDGDVDLTTVPYDCRALAHCAFDRLMALIEGWATEESDPVVPLRLHIGATTRLR